MGLALGAAACLTLGMLTACGTDEEPPAPQEGTLYQTGVETFWAGIGKAYISFEYLDTPETPEEGELYGNVFRVNVDAGDGYSAWLTGSWTLDEASDGTFGDLTLTATWDESAENPTTLADAQSGVAKTYSLTDGVYTIGVGIPSAGTVRFTLDPVKNSMENDSNVTYTVRYIYNAEDTTTLYRYEADAEAGTAGFSGTEQVTGSPDEAYLVSAPKAPVREGYYFAGWQTKAEITQEDIVNGVSKYLWLFGEKLSMTGIAKYESMTEAEREERAIGNEVMLLDSADVDGTVTLYARWVQAKEVATAEEFCAIADDLYGAYKLTADIALTGEWESIGAYFSNYEYYNTEWWTYAFRGTIDGENHTATGVNIVTAEKQVDNYTAEGSVWHDDGTTCNGTAAMFNALAAANISNLTIADATVNVDYNGDYLYVGVLAAFDMGASLTNVSISDCDIDVTFDEEGLTYRTDLFTAVGGLEAGGWTNYVTACAASGNITLNAANKVAHGGEVYLGGLLGENYAYMNACRTDVALTLNYADEATAEEDSEIVINVGGLSGSGTQIGTCTVEADIDVNAVKEEGASSVNVGGIIGAQRYLTTSGCIVTAAIATDGCSLDAEKGALNAGGVGGRIDVYYMLQILAYTPVANAGAENNVQNVTINGEVTQTVIADAVSVIPGCWYVANGDYTVSEGLTVPSNIEEVIAAYGSYMPLDSLQQGIIYIMNTPAQPAA